MSYPLHETAKSSHEQVAAETVVDLITLDQTEFEAQKDAFTVSRIQALEAQAPSVEGAIDSLSDAYEGFLRPDVEVRTAPHRQGFLLDDPKIYESILDETRTFYGQYKNTLKNDPSNKMAYFKAALFATQRAQEAYFGNVSPNNEQKDAHDQLALATEIHSIADFKNVGQCVQRSAVANNMLQFLGVPTSLRFGYMDIEGQGKVGHTFLLVKTPQGRMRLYDPMNPTYFFEGSQLVGTQPRYAKVPEESLADGVANVNLKVGSKTEDGWKYASVPATYHLESNKKEIQGMMDLLNGLALHGVVPRPEVE